MILRAILLSPHVRLQHDPVRLNHQTHLGLTSALVGTLATLASNGAHAGHDRPPLDRVSLRAPRQAGTRAGQAGRDRPPLDRVSLRAPLAAGTRAGQAGRDRPPLDGVSLRAPRQAGTRAGQAGRDRPPLDGVSLRAPRQAGTRAGQAGRDRPPLDGVSLRAPRQAGRDRPPLDRVSLRAPRQAGRDRPPLDRVSLRAPLAQARFGVRDFDLPPSPERPSRVAGRVFAGVGLGLGTVVTTAGVATGLDLAIRGDCQGIICLPGLGGLVVGSAAGYALYPLAVYGGAQMVDGRGHLGGAYLGGLASAALSPAIAYVAEDSWALALTGALLVAGPVVGSELGYRHLRKENREPKKIEVLPTAARSREGWSWGLSGRF